MKITSDGVNVTPKAPVKTTAPAAEEAAQPEETPTPAPRRSRRSRSTTTEE